MLKKQKRKVVIDTNLWISFVYSGFTSPLSFLLQAENIELAFSEELFVEVTHVLHRPKFSKRIDQRSAVSFLELMREAVVFYTPKKQVRAGSDPKDFFLFSLAIEAKASFIITGDKQLLGLEKYKNIQLINLTDFLKLI